MMPNEASKIVMFMIKVCNLGQNIVNVGCTADNLQQWLQMHMSRGRKH
jgi:hypothetical protein